MSTHASTLALYAVALAAGSAACRADVVGNFDSLSAMAARSDAIVVLRVDEHIQPRSLNRPSVNTAGQWSVEECMILKTLKGSLPENKQMRLRLFAIGVTGGPEGFDVYSCHVVFLISRPDDGSGIHYESLKYDNSQIQVSPDCDTRPVAGKSLKRSLGILVAQYRRYRDAKAAREEAFFKQLLK